MGQKDKVYRNFKTYYSLRPKSWLKVTSDFYGLTFKWFCGFSSYPGIPSNVKNNPSRFASPLLCVAVPASLLRLVECSRTSRLSFASIVFSAIWAGRRSDLRPFPQVFYRWGSAQAFLWVPLSSCAGSTDIQAQQIDRTYVLWGCLRPRRGCAYRPDDFSCP